jgi:hypothetical protein
MEPQAGGGLAGLRTDLVEYLILTVPSPTALTECVAPLAELVRAGSLRIIDLVVLVRQRDNAVEVLELDAVPSIAGLCAVDGTVGGLLSDHDLQLAALAIRPGSAGLVLVIEGRWALPLADAAARAGGHIVAGERIPANRVVAAMTEYSRDDG